MVDAVRSIVIEPERTAMETAMKTSIVILSILAAAAIGIAGCSNNVSASGANPGVTPPQVMNTAQQNAAAMAQWSKNRSGFNGPPGTRQP